jgi:hypothetical protein
MGERKKESILMEAFDFIPTDLAANIGGHLSPYQKEHLKPPFHWFIGFIVVIVIGLAALAFGILGWYGHVRDLLFLIAAPLILVLGIIAVVLDRAANRTVREGRVSVIRGPVELETTRFRDIVEYTVRIDQKTFTISQEQCRALTNGEAYCFYYISGVSGYPRSKKILSVQPLNTRIAQDKLE